MRTCPEKKYKIIGSHFPHLSGLDEMKGKGILGMAFLAVHTIISSYAQSFRFLLSSYFSSPATMNGSNSKRFFPSSRIVFIPIFVRLSTWIIDWNQESIHYDFLPPPPLPFSHIFSEQWRSLVCIRMCEWVNSVFWFRTIYNLFVLYIQSCTFSVPVQKRNLEVFKVQNTEWNEKWQVVTMMNSVIGYCYLKCTQYKQSHNIKFA